MRIYTEIDVYTWMVSESWSGARDTIEELTTGECVKVANEIEVYFADYGDITETNINDLLWFERDLIAEFAGYEDWDDLTTHHDWEDGKTISDLTAHPHTYEDELQELREDIEANADEDETEPSHATLIMSNCGWDISEITIAQLQSYYKGVHFVYDDFFCHQ